MPCTYRGRSESCSAGREGVNRRCVTGTNHASSVECWEGRGQSEVRHWHEPRFVSTALGGKGSTGGASLARTTLRQHNAGREGVNRRCITGTNHASSAERGNSTLSGEAVSLTEFVSTLATWTSLPSCLILYPAKPRRDDAQPESCQYCTVDLGVA